VIVDRFVRRRRASYLVECVRDAPRAPFDRQAVSTASTVTNGNFCEPSIHPIGDCLNRC
jgi:hypothetical protein